ncbi:pentatricopeptide repeat-containing protein At1g08070, chloroplastic-like [Nymphaea colorata]|uniref:DYW domain-containing protein n=1 Tax=Nymphaea colorata TaxID=210225 RepID=A0A5K0VFJ1_9MAGN|nr:pentatricopeptide repeat-containing protein At1g08070, chloroplastic-like [Nymphaea colorata]
MKILNRIHAQLIVSGVFNAANTFSFNNLIASYSRSGAPRHVFSLYVLMLKCRCTPNNHTYPSLLRASSSLSPFHAFLLHAHIVKFVGLRPDAFVLAALIDAYARMLQLPAARQVFDDMPMRDVVVWNSMIAGYSRCGMSLEAFLLFREMQACGVTPNEITMVAVLDGCAHLGALCYGRWVHAYLKKKGIRFNCYVHTALIDMYAKCGNLYNACEVFNEMTVRDTLAFNSMIGGFAMHGYGRRALEMFERMKHDGVKPDDVTFIALLSACAHAGLVDEGRVHFRLLRETYRIEPKLEHYGCMVDLLGRAGFLKEAHQLIERMPMKPSAILWRSLLSSCRTHSNIELGQVSIGHLMELDPQESGNYVLLSNIYAAYNRWDDVRRVRKVMKDREINKLPGCSILELDGVLHEFMMADRTHPRAEEIYSMLEEIDRQLHLVGYKPATKDVLFDISEEDKEDALSYHSERLAIAFALIASDAETSIRIVKTLRVCVDCHIATKFISSIYKREIIVRDRSRFHHIKRGVCSCNDYW